jgi:hypothetical protein
MGTTNYVHTFILVADDCPVKVGTPPPQSSAPSVAALTYRQLSEQPYRYTSDDVLFTVYAERHGIPEAERSKARVEFFRKPQACLRASPIGKRYGWGIHSDAEGRVALYGMESEQYRAFASGRAPGSGEAVTLKKAMRSSRA